MGKNRARRCSNYDKMKEMEIDRPYPEEGAREYHQIGYEVESSGKEEKRKTKTIMETYSNKRTGEHQEDRG